MKGERENYLSSRTCIEIKGGEETGFMEAAMRKKTAYNSLSEDLSKRSANTKSFQVLPGRHRTMSFAEQVHYLDRASGAYEAIDNSLVSCEGACRIKRTVI